MDLLVLGPEAESKGRLCCGNVRRSVAWLLLELWGNVLARDLGVPIGVGSLSLLYSTLLLVLNTMTTDRQWDSIPG